MANEQNLVSGGKAHRLTVEEASRGGKASGEARRKRKQMREAIDELLSKEFTDKNGNTVDGVTALIAKVYQRAMDGDMKAVAFLRDTVGEMPVQKIETVEIPPEAYERVRNVLGGK